MTLVSTEVDRGGRGPQLKELAEASSCGFCPSDGVPKIQEVENVPNTCSEQRTHARNVFFYHMNDVNVYLMSVDVRGEGSLTERVDQAPPLCFCIL